MPLGAGNEQHLGLVPIITCVLNTGHQTADTPEFQILQSAIDIDFFPPYRLWRRPSILKVPSSSAVDSAARKSPTTRRHLIANLTDEDIR